MSKLYIVLLAAVLAAACQDSTGNSNMPANHMTGGNMPHDMSNMPANMPMNHDMANMGRMTSAPGAAEQPYDLQFIDSMTNHHQGAVMMSEMALQQTQNAELRAFLQKIIDDQTREIAQMKEWRDKWYAGKPSALNMEMPGMEDHSEKMGEAHSAEMKAMAGRDFDVHFIDMMIPHHDGAVEMAKDALEKAEHPEIKTLANEIIREQEAEIKKMRDWKEQWGK